MGSAGRTRAIGPRTPGALRANLVYPSRRGDKPARGKAASRHSARPDAGRDRFRARIYCGRTADGGGSDELKPQVNGFAGMSWPVSRILFRTAANYRGGEAVTIHLDTPSPGASSGLPAGSGEQPSDACATAPGAAFLALLRVGFA